MKYVITLFILIFSLPLQSDSYSEHIVQVIITAQHYDYYSPWGKGSIRKIKTYGTIVEGGMVLTKAYPLANYILIEAIKHGDKRKYSAEIIVRDYHNGFALLKIKDQSFFLGLEPVKFRKEQNMTGEKTVVIKWDSKTGFKEYTAETNYSAMEMSSREYYYSNYPVLMHYMTTGMNSGGSGEPVFINKELAGISTWFDEKNKTIHVNDVNTIKSMLEDITDNHYNGPPFFKIEYIPIENDINLRQYLGLAKKDNGIYISAIPSLSSGSSVLKKGDVILSINNINIDDSGMYTSKFYGKLNFYRLVFKGKAVGDKITVSLVRNRTKINRDFKLKPFPVKDFIVPETGFDKPPKYFIYGGLIFQELTRSFLNLWGSGWNTKANKRLLHYYKKSMMQSSSNGKRIVILNRILPAQINSGYENKMNLILEKINGIKIKNINNAWNLIKKSRNKFIKFDFTGSGSIVLGKKQVEKDEIQILKKYNIRSSSYLLD